MPGRVNHGGAFALLGTAGSPSPDIATIARYSRGAASSSVARLAPDERRDRLERRFGQRGVIAISDGCYLDSTFFTGGIDPVKPECRPAPPTGRNPSSQTGRTAAAVLGASLLGLGLAYFACTLLIPTLRLEWSDVVCFGANSSPPQTARMDE